MQEFGRFWRDAVSIEWWDETLKWMIIAGLLVREMDSTYEGGSLLIEFVTDESGRIVEFDKWWIRKGDAFDS